MQNTRIIVEGDYCTHGYNSVFTHVLNGHYELGILAAGFIGDCISKNSTHTRYCTMCFNRTKNNIPGLIIKAFIEDNYHKIIQRPLYDRELIVLASLLQKREKRKSVQWPIILKLYFKVVPFLCDMLRTDIITRKSMCVSDYFTFIKSGILTKDMLYKKLLSVNSDNDQFHLEEVLWYNDYVYGMPITTGMIHTFSTSSIQFEIFKTVYISLYRNQLPHELIIMIWKCICSLNTHHYK